LCNDLFKTKKDLDYHVDANHTEILMKKCHFCPLEFRERQVLYDHVFQKHSLAPILRATPCKYCGAKSDVDVLVELHNATCNAKLNGTAASSEEKIESTKHDTNPIVGLGYFVGYRPSQGKAEVEVKALQNSEKKNSSPSDEKNESSKNESNPNQEKVEMEVGALQNSEKKNKMNSDEKIIKDSSKKILRRRVGRSTKTSENISKSEPVQSKKKPPPNPEFILRSPNVTESKTETEIISKDAKFSAIAAYEKEKTASSKPATQTNIKQTMPKPKKGKSNDKSDSKIGLYFMPGQNCKYSVILLNCIFCAFA
jgi:hypothetical protein